MKAQKVRENWDIRISMGVACELDGAQVRLNLSERYGITELCPPGWLGDKEEKEHSSQTSSRPCRIYTKGKQELALVEHETGPEVIVTVGVDLIKTAVVEFCQWLWNKWLERHPERDPTSGQTQIPVDEPTCLAISIEFVEERFPDGRVKVTRRIELRDPPPLSVSPLDPNSSDSLVRMLTEVIGEVNSHSDRKSSCGAD